MPDQNISTFEGLDLDAGLRLLKAMTEGPWVAVGTHIDQYASHPDGNRLLSGGDPNWSEDDYSKLSADDIAAIVWLRNNGEKLITLLRLVNHVRYKLQYG